MSFIFFSSNNEDSDPFASNTIDFNISLTLNDSANANIEPPFGVPVSSGLLDLYEVLFSPLPNLSFPNGSFCVLIIDDFSLGRPTALVSLYPGGTSSLLAFYLPAPYNEAKSCGVPYDLPDLYGSFPSFSI